MPKTPEALVEPELLAWARRTAGLDIPTAAKKAGVSPQRLQAWERDEARPTIRQLRELARVYKRPLAVFYLADPPADFQALRDFRRIPGFAEGPPSPELLWQIRRAHQRHELALELAEELEEEFPEFTLTATLSSNQEQLAHTVRDDLGIRFSEQARWSAGYESFNGWRAALERRGVLVFQALDVEVSEARGFSIHADSMPVVVVNMKDSVNGRIFTMLHEMTHLLLRQGGLCNLREGSASSDEAQTEIFCNRVAGSVLVPSRYLVDDPPVKANEGQMTWTDEVIQGLADRYGVSREVIVRRLLTLGRTTQEFYQSKREEYQREQQEREEERARKGGGGFAPPHRIAVSTAGPAFVKLVLNSYYQERINASDIADLLEVRLKHLNKIETEVLGRAS